MKNKHELAEEYAYNNMESFSTHPFYFNDKEKLQETFVVGYETKEKQIIDKINALKSKLAEEKVKKLTKIINQERVKELETQIKILQSLL